MQKVIYRIEHRANQRIGAYKFDDWGRYCNIYPHKDYHPTFNQDWRLKEAIEKVNPEFIIHDGWNDSPIKDLFFAFESLESLKSWFNMHGWLAALIHNEFIIGMYECQEGDYFIGEKQVLFLMDKATRFDYKEIVDILDERQIGMIQLTIEQVDKRYNHHFKDNLINSEWLA